MAANILHIQRWGKVKQKKYRHALTRFQTYDGDVLKDATFFPFFYFVVFF